MRIGVTMGDPDGVGPELMRASIAALRPTMPHVEWVLFGSQDAFQGTPGELHLSSGAFPERDAIEQSAEALKEGSIDAVVTAPVAKHAFQGDFPGHTELFKERLGVPRVAMMMAGPRLRVIPVTTHIALRDVTHVLTSEDIFATARLAHRTLVEQLDIATPRLALAGLNPHAGDRGLFGDEERRILQPAIEAIRAEGITIEGPSSPDTVFYQALQGRFDLVLAGYHDQALIPFKMVHFTDGVNVTLGLPRPRTSPDHGPAYDIAGQGIADPTSTRSAIEMACRLARPRAEPSASRARERSARKA
mgnify:CR=1 FL=1